jgi:hypothetical protein
LYKLVGTIHLKGKNKIEKNHIMLSLIMLSSILVISCRKIQQLKKKVENKARVEGCIVEAELVEEATNFLTPYFMPHVP